MIDGCIDGWMNGWIDGDTGRQIHTKIDRSIDG